MKKLTLKTLDRKAAKPRCIGCGQFVDVKTAHRGFAPTEVWAHEPNDKVEWTSVNCRSREALRRQKVW